MTYINDWLPAYGPKGPTFKPLTNDQLQRVDDYARQVNDANDNILAVDTILAAVASINGGLADSFRCVDEARVLIEEEGFNVQFGGENDPNDPADVYIPEPALTPEEAAEEAAWYAGEAERQAEYEAKAATYDRDHPIQFTDELTQAARDLIESIITEENIPLGDEPETEIAGYVHEVTSRIRSEYDTQVILATKTANKS